MITTAGHVLVIAALLLLHASAIGFAVLGRLALWPGDRPSGGNAYLSWFFAMTIGLAADITGLFALGLARWLTPRVTLALGAVMLLAALPRFATVVRGRGLVRSRVSASAIVELLAVLLLFVSTALAAFHAPGHWDDTSYQLPVARFYLQHGGLAVNEYLRYPLFPHNINLLLALGLMLGGDLMAQVVATLPLFVIAIGLLGVSLRITGSVLVGGVATAMLFFSGPVSLTLGYAYVDNGFALFCWGATLAVAGAARGEQGAESRRWVIVAGVLAGMAAGSKYFGLAFVALLGAYLLLVRRDWKATIAYATALLLFGSWWYIRNVFISGDPIHPSGGAYFGYYLWNAVDLTGQVGDLAQRGVPRNLLYFWDAFRTAGVLLWILAIASVLFDTAPSTVRLFQWLCVPYVLFWFFVAQLERYLAPVFGLASFLAAWALAHLGARILATVGAARSRLLAHRLLAGALLLALAVPWAVVRYDLARTGLAEWNVVLEQRAGYTLFRRANALRQRFGSRLVQIGFEDNIYFFEGTVIGDWLGPGRYTGMLEGASVWGKPVGPAQMKQVLDRFDSRMLIVSSVRYPTFDPNAYGEQFQLIQKTDAGALLLLR